MRLTDETKLLARMKAMELAIMSIITALPQEQRDKFDADLKQVAQNPSLFGDGEQREGIYGELYEQTLLSVLTALLRPDASPSIVPNEAGEADASQRPGPELDDLLKKLKEQVGPAEEDSGSADPQAGTIPNS